jgi:RimJ/RimL family protein N-acetyltransferase
LIVRALTPADADAYVALRAEALADAPFAFLGSPGDDIPSDPETMRAQLARPETWAIFAAAESPSAPLLAVAGVMRSRRLKTRHRADVWGVYTTPRARGRGLARAVVGACIEHARAWPGVDILSLCVSTRTPGAQRVYESLGFRAWGVQPDYVRIGGESAAEVHMQLALVPAGDAPSP